MTDLSFGASLSAVSLFPEEPIAIEGRSASSPRSRYDRVVAVRRMLHARVQRARLFGAKLFSDPAWDLLLELYAASLAQRRLTVSRLSERSLTPMTTTLRWIAAFEAEGLAERQKNPLDARHVFIVLTAKAVDLMDNYFDETPAEAVQL